MKARCLTLLLLLGMNCSALAEMHVLGKFPFDNPILGYGPSLQFSEDGAVLYGASDMGLFTAWSFPKGEEILSCKFGEAPHVYPDQSCAVVGSNKDCIYAKQNPKRRALEVHSVKQRKILFSKPDFSSGVFALSVDGAQIAAQIDNKFQVFSTLTEELIFAQDLERSSAVHIQFSLRAEYVACINRNKTLFVFDLKNKARLLRVELPVPASILRISPNGAVIAVVDYNNQKSVCTFWSIATGKQLQLKGLAESDLIGLTEVRFSPDSSRVALAKPGKITVANLDTTLCLYFDLPNQQLVTGLAFTRDSKTLASYSDKLRTLNLVTKEWATAGIPCGRFYCTCFTPDGDYVFAGGENQVLTMWDIKKRSLLWAVDAAKWLPGLDADSPARTILGLEFTKSGDELILTTEDTTYLLKYNAANRSDPFAKCQRTPYEKLFAFKHGSVLGVRDLNQLELWDRAKNTKKTLSDRLSTSNNEMFRTLFVVDHDRILFQESDDRCRMVLLDVSTGTRKQFPISEFRIADDCGQYEGTILASGREGSGQDPSKWPLFEINIKTGEKRLSPLASRPVPQFEISPKRNRILVLSEVDPTRNEDWETRSHAWTLTLSSLPDGKKVRSYDLGAWPRPPHCLSGHINFSPDGTKAVIPGVGSPRLILMTDLNID